MSFLWQDLQYSARSLRRSPLFSIITLFSLAVGIGAHTATIRGGICCRIRCIETFSSRTKHLLLGVGPAVGRVLTVDDDRTPGAHPVVVLAFEYCQSRFDRDPKVVGQKILINSYPMTIVGVSAAGFAGLSPGVLPRVRFQIPMRKEVNPRGGQLEERRSRWVQAFGRRKAGVTNDQVKANLQAVFRQVIGMEVGEKEFAQASSFTRENFFK